MKYLKHRSLSALLPPFMWLLWLAYALSVNTAAANDERVFRFNISPSGYPPYLIVNQETPSGIMWDVVALITERLGYQLVAEKVPRKRVDQMLLEGYIDGTPRAREWTHKPEKFLFTDPIVEVREVFFTPAISGKTYQSPDDLLSKTLVTHLGYVYPKLQSHFESGAIQRFDVSRDRDMFNFLLHGEHFDAAVADLLVGKWIQRKEGLRGQFNVSDKGISSYGFRIMLHKDNQAFARRFNAELAHIRENGELNAILANYR